MNPIHRMERIDRHLLEAGVEILSRRDRDLADLARRHGTPPLWNRRPGFDSLVRIILEQHVSLASGRAVYRRLRNALGSVSPHSVADYGADGLRRLGLTRQKSAYLVFAAQYVLRGDLELGRMSDLSDDEARNQLMRVTGIGRWTADVYLLSALGRPDIWPPGDVALLSALQALRGLSARPPVAVAEGIAAEWAPWRSVAARMLWHGYLQGSLRTRSRLKD